MLLGPDHLDTLAQGSGREFDAGLAVALAEQAAASYLPPQKYDLLAQRAGFDRSVSFRSGATQLAMAYAEEPSVLVISPRGSNQWTDWLENIQAWKTQWLSRPLRGFDVHAGFFDQTLRVLEDLEDHLLELPQPHKIFVTGHSLGGAVAQYLSAALTSWGWQPEAVYTFGSPRAATAPWRSGYMRHRLAPVYRIVHLWRGELDVVTRVPWRRCGWRHLGEPVVIYEPEEGHDVALMSGERAWLQARKESKDVLPAWRPVSRLWRGRRAHDQTALLGALRSYLGGISARGEGMIAASQLREAEEK